MNPHWIMDEFAMRCGWNTDTQLELCLRYIEQQHDHVTFMDFLAQIEQGEHESASQGEV